MPTNAEILGQNYIFGFESKDAPVINNFFARKAELRYEPEIYVTATDGEGMTEAVAVTLPAKRKITGTFSGYVKTGFSQANLLNTFSFKSRKFIVKSISDPRNKGEFAEVSIEAESFALIQ
jgi:hypothetical protein